MDVKLSENGDNIIAQITNNLYYKILKDEDEQIKKLMVDYAKEHNAEIRFIDEEKVKLIIDLGCKEYLKNYQSGYISKDKIREKIKELDYIRRTALNSRAMEMMEDKINILNLLLKEN